MRAPLPVPPQRKLTDPLPNRAERRHPGSAKHRTNPSRLTLAVGFNRSSQRAPRRPSTPEDHARVEAAQAKRVRRGRA